MEEHVSILTVLANKYLGHAALVLLAALHIQPSNAEMPIPEHIVMATLLLIIVTLLCLILAQTLGGKARVDATSGGTSADQSDEVRHSRHSG